MQGPEKKRNRMKKKKWLAALFITAGILTVLLGRSVLTGQAFGEEDASAGISAGKEEELIYAELLSVTGNEISCALTDSGEEREYQIPVGTVVTTKQGTETTFVRLSRGNRVALLLEKGTDIIKAVWITG